MCGSWPKYRLKYIAKIAPSVDISNISDDDEVTFLPMAFIRNGYFIPNSATLSNLNSSYNSFKNGDILMAKVTPCFENGNITIAKNLVNDFGYGTSEIFVIRADNTKVLNTFLFYLLQEYDFKSYAISDMTGTGGLKRVSSSFVADYSFNIPSLAEQKIITIFLDGKCGQIDTIIDYEEKIIGELKEYKKYIIYKAITKGVRDVPLKHCASINDNVLPETTHPNYRFRYIDIGSVDFYNGIMGYQEMDFANSPSRARRLVRKGNIIVSTVRTYLKAIAEIIDDKDVVVSTGFAVLSPKQNVNPRYLGYFCKSDLFCDEVERNSFGTSYPAINSSLLGSLSVILPALAEQQKIADYLDIKTSEIDNLITLKQQKISELKEYKKSLIYEYVTGKKEPPKDVT